MNIYLHPPAALPLGKSPMHQSNRRLLGPRDFVGLLEKRKYLAFALGHPTHSLVTIPAELFWQRAKQINRNIPSPEYS